MPITKDPFDFQAQYAPSSSNGVRPKLFDRAHIPSVSAPIIHRQPKRSRPSYRKKQPISSNVNPARIIAQKIGQPSHIRIPILPPEICHLILTHCHIHDMPSLRLTCLSFQKYVDTSLPRLQIRGVLRIWRFTIGDMMWLVRNEMRLKVEEMRSVTVVLSFRKEDGKNKGLASIRGLEVREAGQWCWREVMMEMGVDTDVAVGRAASSLLVKKGWWRVVKGY